MAVMMQEGGWKDVNMFVRYMNRRKSMRQRIAKEYNDYMKGNNASILDIKKKQRDWQKALWSTQNAHTLTY